MAPVVSRRYIRPHNHAGPAIGTVAPHKRCMPQLYRPQAIQRLTAQYQGRVVTIHYPFHPRCGEQVEIWRRHGLRGVVMLVIRQADGTMTQVPEWMCSPMAAAAQICGQPSLALSALRELRIVADEALTSLSASSGGRHGTSRASSSAGSVHGNPAAEPVPPRGEAGTPDLAGSAAARGDEQRGSRSGGRR